MSSLRISIALATLVYALQVKPVFLLLILLADFYVSLKIYTTLKAIYGSTVYADLPSPFSDSRQDGLMSSAAKDKERYWSA